MQQKKVNPIIQWWVTPKLPAHDIFELPLLINKSISAKVQHLISCWLIHPLKRRLAWWYLRLLQKVTPIKVIGITGSTGKTTTKEMLASILKLTGSTVWTADSIDPVYNIPNTILKCTPWTKYLVLEMGVEYPREMDFYLWLARPDIGVITNIFPTHIEFLGDVAGVFQEKSKLVLALAEDGIAVLNKNDRYLRALAERLKTRVVWFDGRSEDPLIQNANAARSVARVLGIAPEKIKKGLKFYARPEHRFKIIKHKSGATIFDDSYNSNPEALLSTLRVFNKLAKNRQKIAVLGDMLELGKIEEEQHRRLGKEFAKKGFEAIIGVGKATRFFLAEVKQNSPKTKTYQFSTWQEASSTTKGLIKPHVFALVKGSRSIGLDKLVDVIMKDNRI